MYYEIYQDDNNFWRWRLQAGNNRIIASGEAYYNKADCVNAVNLVRGSAAAPVYGA